MHLLGHENTLHELESTSLMTDWNILQDVFPGRFLNETRTIRCVPMVQVTPAEKDKLIKIHRIQNIDRYLYLVAYNM